MAIAYDNGLQTAVNGSVSSVTRALTLTGSDRFLLSWALTTATADMSSVAYNGTNLTKAGEINPSGSFSIECHYLINPSSGANNLVWTQGSSTTFVTSAVAYTGVSQSFTPVTGTDDDTSGDTTLDASFTTTVDNSWIAWCIRNDGSDPNASGTNFTRRTTSAGNGLYIGDTGGAITPAGATSMSVTMSQVFNNYLFNLQIEPVGAATTIKTWNGIVRANLKTLNGTASASIKTINGIT